MRRFIVALGLFLPGLVAAVQLQYLPSVPMQHTSKLVFDVQESLPILNLTTKGNQLLKFEMFLKDDGKNRPLNQLPLALALKLRDVFIYLNINGLELTIDPRGKKASVPLIQFTKLLDKSIPFKIDTKGHLIEEGDALKQILKEHPALKDLPLEALLNELFFPVFALCGEELEVGKKFQKTAFTDSTHHLPSTLAFTITAINDQEITASMEGEIAPQKLAFASLMADAEGQEHKIEMTISGKTHGTISWQRSNALLYSFNTLYDYQAEVNVGGLRFTIKLNVSNASSSTVL